MSQVAADGSLSDLKRWERTPNEADNLKDQIADGGRSLELQYQATALDVKSTKPSEEGPTGYLNRMYCEETPPV